MDSVDPLRFIFAFLFVLGLIAGLGYLLKRFGRSQQLFPAKGEGRLHIIELRHLDPKRRLALIRRDEVEHLLLLADGRETVIESNIKAGPRVDESV